MSDLISRNAVVEIIQKEIDRTEAFAEHDTQINILSAVNTLPAYDADAVAIAMKKQTPYKIIYKNGFGHCKCGCEFESVGYSGEEYCPECGQKVWVGGYNGEENRIVSLNGVKSRKNSREGSLWTKRH